MTDEELKSLITSAVGDKLQELFGGLVREKQSKYTLFGWLETWLEACHKPNVSEEVYKKDCGVLRNHVYSKSEYNKLLSEFKPFDLQLLVQSISFPRQRVIASNMLVAALRFAFINDLIPKDITIGFKKPTHEYDEDRALTHLEERKFLRVLHGHRHEIYFKTVLYTGLRRNEALGLMRGDIDFERDEIHIERQVTMNGDFKDKLKTQTSKRVIKLFPLLKKELLQFEYCKADVRLFDFKPVTVTHSFRKFCDSIDLFDISLKSLRTTFATRCDEIGIPESIIQAWLGHTSFKTTKKHYIKLNEDFVNAEFEKALGKMGQNFD